MILSKKMSDEDSSIFLSKTFIFVLISKLIFSFLFASHYLKEYFVPFINWFVISGFKNPWEYFYSIGQLKMFPYPTIMLWIMAFPTLLFKNFLSNDWHNVNYLNLFLMRIPLLVFDILIFNLFLKIFPTKKRLILYTYWCSPIVFFINYIHGQLDIIPTAIFLLAMSLLLKQRYLYSVILLAIAGATKTHIFIFTPFIFLFLYKQRIGITKLLTYLGIFTISYFLLLSPYISSFAFREMVFNTIEQKRIYEFALPVSSSLSIVVCPIVIFLLFMKFASFKKLNNEILIMFAGIVFACLVIFATPMPGWFIWSLPFLIYFYLNNVEHSRVPFVLYNFIYSLYFILFFEKNYLRLSKVTDVIFLDNLALSLLLSSVGFTAIWMYQIGIKRNEELKIKQKPLLIGIGGDSSTGKHTTYEILKSFLGEELCVPVFGDNFHKWERGNENWKIYTHLNPVGNKLHEEVEKALALKEGNEIDLVEYNHNTGQFKNPKVVESNKFIFFIGLHPFYLKQMRELIDIKIFMDTDETLRQFWKINRDLKERGYEESKVLEQITSRSEDARKFIIPQKDFADLIIHYFPVSTIDLKNQSAKNIEIKTRYIIDNSINLENLHTKLNRVRSLRVEYNHLSNLIHQEFEIQGNITSQQVANIGYNLGLNFDELLIKLPRWLADYDGITQLIFLVIYNHKMRVK